MSLKGGYKILDLSQNPSYDEITKILDTEKVILVSGLVVDNVEQKDCFASVEENEGVYTLKTPDKIIKISFTNGVEVIEGVLLDSFVDNEGNKRFIEGDITFEDITGVSKVYGKWSLSGSHLMIVICPKIDNGAEIGSNIPVAYLDDIPQWIKDKIIPVASSIVSNFSVTCFNETTTSTQSLPVYLRKTSEHFYIAIGSITATDDRYTRIAFDLLIDMEG